MSRNGIHRNGMEFAGMSWNEMKSEGRILDGKKVESCIFGILRKISSRKTFILIYSMTSTFE
jgi:hypothetical protein